MLPVALAEAAEEALAKIALESIPTVVSLIEKLAGPHVPHDVIVAVDEITKLITESPTPKTTAERAAIALAANLAADRAAEALVR